jgi:hypothetical protein
MAKRIGRPPKDPASKKGAHVSIRMSAKLREALDNVRCQPDGGGSLSEEIELRLWQSLTIDKKIEARFGGPATAALLQIIAERIMAIETETGGEEKWLDHPFVFGQARVMIDLILDHLQPPGRRTLPKVMRRRHPALLKEVQNIGRHHAMRALTMLEAVMTEPKPSYMAPTEYYKAALPLGRRLGRRTKPKGEAQ